MCYFYQRLKDKQNSFGFRIQKIKQNISLYLSVYSGMDNGFFI